ncbi:MAG: hypothetical protein HKN45_08725 [Flavobacteriales bacterium]|nr:hypothetical protein [Flavobacteriales bacterium]
MRGFIIKVGLYVVLLLCAHYFAAHFADGRTDGYYLRFTSPQQSNLIIGTSRAAQGLRPEYLDRVSDSTEFFNYAFTLLHSPYGEVYRESIKKKIKEGTLDGTFIVTVDPWSISAKGSDANDPSKFKEKNTELGRTSQVNSDPNLEYLLENYPYGWGRLILRRIKQNPSMHTLHPDGWLEINVPMDRQSVRKRTDRKMKDYRKNAKTFSPSEIRLTELKNTIEFLQARGDVHLIRLPIPGEMIQLEEEYMPDFYSSMNNLSQQYNIPFYDMTLLPDTFTYTDGNHLHKSSSKTVSRLVAEYLSKRDQS